MATIPFFKLRPCSVKQRLPKGTFIDMLSAGSKTQEFFLKIPDDKWTITSFDPSTRRVCVEITTKHGSINTVSVTLNHLAPTSVETDDTTQTNKSTQSFLFAAPSNSPELLSLNLKVKNSSSSLLSFNTSSLTQTQKLPAF